MMLATCWAVSARPRHSMVSLHMMNVCLIMMAVVFVVPSLVTAQSYGESTTYGREFVLGFLPNVNGHPATQLEVIVGSPVDNVPFVVESVDSVIYEGNVSSSAPVSVTIPSNLDVLGNGLDERQKGVRVVSKNDDPIFVLGLNSVEDFNYGTFLTYPCLGESEADDEVYEYRILSIDPEIFSLFMLVGCSNDTRVTITPTQAITVPNNFQDPNSTFVNLQEGEEYSATLHQMSTLLIISFQLDLSGSKIVSNKPLTVISGNDCAYVPQASFDCEPISVQVPPILSWQTNFLIAGYAGRMSDQLYFSLVPAQENTTLVATCGESQTTTYNQVPFLLVLNSDEQYCYFDFDKPVFLAQLAYGESIDNLGDPAIAIISGVDQYVNRIEFVLLPTEDFPNSYISITVAAEHYDPANITLDGTMVNCEWVAIYNRSSNIVGYGCNVTMPAQSNSTATQHTLSHSDPNGKFSATVYGFRASPAAQGYAYLSGQKLDVTADNINECSTNNGGCDQVCTNTIGSFSCSCNDGFSLNTNGATCNDINECSTNNGGCAQVCTNTVGSFSCSCNDGYSLNADGATCDDVDECSTNNGGCVQVCTNAVGSFSCSCNNGFTLNADGATCDDVDECSVGNGGCDQVCINTAGSFGCICSSGYSLNVDGATCDDVDECSTNNGGCVQVCTNTVGSFSCSCNDGYSLNADGATCDDVDECSTNNGGCVQVCTNAVGSFSCSCNNGFTLNADGATCDDVDECSVGNGGCDQVCINTAGSFGCICSSGYSLNVDGATCDDVDECSTNNGGCVQVCTNTVGSFSCSCNDGYSLNADGTTCDDVDECSTNNGGCAQVCTNTVGSFNCDCDSGFSLNADGKTCDSDSLQFIPVTMFGNVRELPRREDSFSQRIIIPNPGLLYGDERLTSAFVNENGVISFNTPWSYSHPALFPTNNFNIRSRGRALAPFWSDIDIRRSGNIWYATASEDDPQDQMEYQELQRVNNYVDEVMAEGGVSGKFNGAWMLVAHWDHVHPSPHGANDRLGIPEEELERTNNFQAVLVTNFSHTFAIYNYICGEIQWSGFGNDKALVGYLISPEVFNNHPASGFSLIGDAISCPSTEGGKRRRKRQIGQGMGNSMLQQVGIGDPDIQLCISGTAGDATLATNGIQIQFITTLLSPCPPQLNLARNDVANFMLYGTIDNSNCYITTNPVQFNVANSQTNQNTEFDFTQQCCYGNSRSLIVDSGSPLSGGLLFYHPLFSDSDFITQEQQFRETCCTVANPSFCNRYYLRRPINDGAGYESPSTGAGNGDPHFRTLDGRQFDFQGRGEYNTMNAFDDDGNITYSIQGRQNVLRNINGVTMHTSIAFGKPNEIAYELEAYSAGRSIRVYQTAPEDSRGEITAELINRVPRYDANKKSVLVRNGNSLVAADFQSGIAIHANTRTWRGTWFLDWNVRVPQTFREKTEGLLGFLDGDRRNDFRLRDGTQLPRSDPRTLYNNYDSWRVPEEDRMFFTQGRSKRQVIDDSNFEPVFLSDFNITNDQIVICQGNEECLLDLIVTGDMDVAMGTLEEGIEVNATVDMLENLSPNISANGTLRINLGEDAVYNIEVVDPEDNVTLTVEDGLPSNSFLEELDDGEFLFRWNLQELTNEPLVFVATDTRNASSTHTPTVEVCACANDGVCTVAGLLTTNSTITMACLCTEAFSGQFCEEDRNGCSEVECFEGVECLDVPAPGIGAVCGACPLGFAGDGLKCYDVDECASNSSQCEELCFNTEGSYQCDCSEGYQLVGTTQCEDVDECAENLHDCEQVCENTVGSYNCSCESGFTLDSDARNCTAIQPCADGGGCSHVCAVVDGMAQCFCPLGLQLSTTGGMQCIDIDECLNSTCAQTCVNTFGSFECACNDGYTLLSNGRTCEDIDECFEAALDGIDLCVDDPNTQCSNREGSFECVCAPGFARDNGTCQTIEEEPPPPPPVATPPNGLESSVSFFSPTLNISDFTPERQQQFREVTANAVVGLCMNTTCSVVITNGNMEQRFNLQVRAQNVAIPSGTVNQLESGELNITFYVQLDDGSILNVENLTTAVQGSIEDYRYARFLPDIDECITNNGGCDQVCINIVNSFYCDCDSGYALNANGATCDDVDECSTNNGGCDQVCTNIVSSFNCSCNDGYTLNADGATCDDIDECTTNTDNCDQLCTNTVGSFQCSCVSGYSLNINEETCDDIDECSTNNGGCDQVCTNTVGSFNCSCNDGFALNTNGATCDDIDECSTNNGGCDQVCTNTVGSFVCSCNDGYSLNVDGVTCDDIVECSSNNGGCDQVCTNIHGSFVCSCNDGFALNTNGATCDDIDECSTNNGGCDQVCTNTVGSFNCNCGVGFSLSVDGASCDDVDECSTNNGGCDQVCTNTVGSFSCSCNNGYSLNADGVTCDDIVECSSNNGGCDQVCNNIDGSFVCSCNGGFTLNADGATCDDINECSTNNGGCDQVCTNTVGSFNCSCNDGFILNADGATCDDIDECTIEMDNCDQVCTNTIGSFNCSCGVGFSLSIDGASCVDINECSTNNGGCDQVCTNTVGSFNCSCNDGYTLNVDGATCDDIDECTIEIDDCDQVCTNTFGSFNCSCNDGYSLNVDGVTCDDMIECSTDNGGCDQVCTNIHGSFVCSCNEGFSLNTDGGTCDDINECSTNNGGCDQVCTNTVGSFNCSCNDGFALNTDGATCDDINECSTNNGGCDQVCTNTVGSFNCSCNDGFALNTDGATCDDIDECSTNNGGCNHLCSNTVGSFNCTCYDGYTLNADGATCDDIDECTIEMDNCDQVCTNTISSFNCSCGVGFSLSIDGATCDDVDECSTNNGGCDQVCTNTVGSFNCSCNDGFALNTDGATCDDIDECSTNNGGCDHVCSNTVGSFNCTCYDGYTLNADGATCDDIDECTIEMDNCDQVCTNTIGSFNCSCGVGFSLSFDGASCDDVDECSTNNGGCDQVCTNTVGSFNCSCNDGYSLNVDGATCDDMVECFSNNGGCDHLCTNIDGSFVCSCNDGFSLNVDGATCDDINECSINNGGCDQVCTNTVGSFSCSCNDGYSLNVDGVTCDDIDECTIETDNCDQVCTNTVGSFNCSCEIGFSLNADERTCDDINECSSNNGGCDQVCTNTVGSFNCSCNDGYTLNDDGATCDDINECSTNNGGCDQVCTNTVGSFNCSCNDGFILLGSDGKTCDAMALLPKIEEQAGLLISLNGYNTQTFTVDVQKNFKETTANALNMYCVETSSQECQAIAISKRKRQSRLFTEEDIVITNIVEIDSNSLQFDLYVLLEEELSVLPRDIVQLAVQDNTEVYQEAGFTSVSAQFLVVTTTGRLSTSEMVGIIVSSVVAGVLLVLGLVLGLIVSYTYCCHNKQKYNVRNKQFTGGEMEFTCINPIVGAFEDSVTSTEKPFSFDTANKANTPRTEGGNITTFKGSGVDTLTKLKPKEPEN